MKINLRILIILLSLCASGHSLYAKENALRLYAAVDRKMIFIGDMIRYEINASYREELEVLMPSLKDGMIGDFEIKDSGRIYKKGFFGGRRKTDWYMITAYSVGKQVIPQLEVKYRKAGTKDWSILKTLAINIDVQSVLPKGPGRIDIKDVKGPFGFFEINWPVAAGVTILIAALAYFIRRRMSRAKPGPMPHETAFEELEIAKSDFAKTGDVKAYYVAISDCVRRYIERAFRMKAPEMTTEEFLESIKDARQLDMEKKGLLREFMNACDLVKFAKYGPTKQETGSVYESAKKFIEETKR